MFPSDLPLANSFTLPVFLKSTKWATDIGSNLFLVSLNQISLSKYEDQQQQQNAKKLKKKS